MTSRQQQSGAALLIMLTLLLLIAGYSTFLSLNAGAQSRKTDVHARLQRAKEALIARAVTDANRPGSLPCPDLITDDNGLNNHPGDGKSDNLTRNDCPSHAGWLPWVTLDLPELSDDSGTRLWYILARPLRDDDIAPAINSDTATELTLDGRSDIAALIIAPGAAVNGQNRPTNQINDYLDGENSNNDLLFVSAPSSESFNDVVLALTREELMSAVEKRVAAEVRSCLEQHASANGNAWKDYPWPAPFNSSKSRGKAGSYFGQIPLTQAGAGPQALLAASSKDLQGARSNLGTAVQAIDQMKALISLNEHLAYAKNLYDRLYTTTKELALTAKASHLNLLDLDSTLIAANSNNRISVTERKTIQGDGNTLQSQIGTLHNALVDSGIDVFPNELNSRNLSLHVKLEQAKSNPTSSELEQLRITANDLLQLLSKSSSPNIDIQQSLNNAFALSAQSIQSLQTALAAPDDSALLGAALNTAALLKAANEQLDATITGNRIALHPTEITLRISRLNSALETFTTLPASTDDLKSLLSETQSVINRINTSSSSILPLRSNALNALSNAIAATDTTNNQTLLSNNVREAIVQSEILAQAMTSHGDNLTRESLNNASQNFNNRLDTFNTVVTRTQAEMVPYAENLRLAAVNVQFWAEIIYRQAGNISTLARKSPEAGKSQINANAAYTWADLTLTGINKSTGTLKKLQDLLDDPNKPSKRTAATSALNDTLTQLDNLLVSTASLGQNLHSNEAEAFPVLWYGSRCAFLQPGSDNTSWWLTNQWSNTIFFQISSRMRVENKGNLTVNGAGKHHSIVISAGKALAAQDRPMKRSIDYFESSNADLSRDGDAPAPSPHFISRASSPDFNDRLAF